MSFRYRINSNNPIDFAKRVDDAVLRGDTLIKLHKATDASMVNVTGYHMRYEALSFENKQVAILECGKRG